MDIAFEEAKTLIENSLQTYKVIRKIPYDEFYCPRRFASGLIFLKNSTFSDILNTDWMLL